MCQYCSKEFRYPSNLKRHLKLKNACSDKISSRVSLTSDRVSSASDRVNLASNRVSEKNMVPILLSLA